MSMRDLKDEEGALLEGDEDKVEAMTRAYLAVSCVRRGPFPLSLGNTPCENVPMRPVSPANLAPAASTSSNL